MSFRTIPQRLDRLGVPIPERLASVFALDAVLGEIRASNPTADLGAEVLAGKLDDPAKLRARIAKCAQDMAAHHEAIQIGNDLEDVLDKRARTALRESGTEIIEAMRPTFDRAIAVFMAAVDSLGADPRPDTGEVSPMLGRLFSEWQTAGNELRSIQVVLDDVHYLEHGVAWYVERTDDLAAARNANRGRGVWDLVVAGLDLRLNTPDEAEALLAAERQAATTRVEHAAADRDREQAEHKAQLRESRATPKMVTKL